MTPKRGLDRKQVQAIRDYWAAPPRRVAAFEVHTPDGHTFKVYSDGSTEGFPDGAFVFNRIPLLIAHG
jgi:hypothetical protein